MSEQANRKYNLTVILDSRGYEAPVEQLETKMTELLGEVGGTVETIENLGRREFVRVTEKDHTGDIYLRVEVNGPASLPAELQDKVRLDKQVKQVMAQSA